MVDLQTYVLLLLSIAAVGMYFIFRVVSKQLRLFKLPIRDKQVKSFRHTLFMISLVIIIMGLIPISINVYTLFGQTSRPPQVPLISLVYSLGVHLQSLLLSYLLWRVYRLAAAERITTDATAIGLQHENDILRENTKGGK